MKKLIAFSIVMFGLTSFILCQAETAFGMQQTEPPRVVRTFKPAAQTKAKRKSARRKKPSYPYVDAKGRRKLDYHYFVPGGKPLKKKTPRGKVDLSKVPHVVKATRQN